MPIYSGIGINLCHYFFETPFSHHCYLNSHDLLLALKNSQKKSDFIG
jgi:hypothetical protein